MIKKIKHFLFKNTTTKQTVVKNVAWLSVSQIAGRIFRGLFIIFAARLLGATEYGVFSYALGLAGFFTPFADVGITSILTRDASRDPKRSSSYFATSFWIKIFLLVFTTLLIIFVAPLFSKINSIEVLLYFVALLTIFDNFREFFISLFRAQEKMELEALVNVSMNIAIAAIGAVILYISKTAEAVTISYVGSAGVGVLIAGFLVRGHLKKVFEDFDKKLISPTLKAALPIVGISLLGVFMLNIDVIIIGWFRTAAEIGYYSAGQKIVQLLYVIPAIIASAFFPIISRAVEKKENQKISLIMERAISAIFALALPLTIGGIILGAPLIKFLYGAEYLPAILTFQILLLTNFVVFPQTLLSNFIVAYNKQAKIAIYVGISAIGNVVLDLLLIPKFGIAGSAAATVIVQLLYNFLTWNMVKKINPFKTLIYLKKIFVATIGMGISAFLLNLIQLPVLLNIAISALIYGGILLALKEPIIEELKLALKHD